MEYESDNISASREHRYQWIINVLLVVMGFFAGILFEAERMKTQVVSNTVEIRLLRDTLNDIKEKLDTLIDDRRTVHTFSPFATRTDTNQPSLPTYQQKE